MLSRSRFGLAKVSCAALVFSALAFNACQSSDGDGGNKGGDGGGGDSGEGGDGGSPSTGGKTGSGGKGGSGNTAGSGGQSGQAGSGGGSSGSGGAATGGMGGTTPMGGSSGSMCEPATVLEGDGDDKERLICGASCVFRPNWKNTHTCGPDGSKYTPVALKTSGFCGEQYNKDGIFEIKQSQGRLYAAAYNQALASGGIVNAPVAKVARAYLPGGQAGYDAAASGKVAVTLWTSAFVGSQDRFKIENVHEHLVQKGEIPYTIAVFLSNAAGAFPDGDNGAVWAKRLKDEVIPALKQKWPKIANDPNYFLISGQSTAGAHAFDVAWLGTDVVAKAIGGSPSVVCFTCMGGQGSCAGACENKNDTYVKEVKFCPARPIRFTATVGTCDIMGSLPERIASSCRGGGGSVEMGDGAVDASQCGANWEKWNRELATALKDKGVPHQLFVIEEGRHVHETWGGVALPHQLVWAFKDITCKQ